MKTLFKSVLFSSLTLSAFCDQAPAKPMPQVSMQDPNPTDRFGTRRSWNMFITGEALWFKPLNVGYVGRNFTVTNSLTPTSQGQDIRRKAISNEFDPAFRVALGYNTPFNGWDFALIYTRFEYKHNSGYYETQVGGLTGSANAVANNRKIVSNAQGTDTYKLSYNLGDLDLGRMYKVSKKLRLRPHLGVRGLWLTQQDIIPDTNFGDRYFNTSASTSSTQQNGTTRFSRWKMKATLIGLECGIDSLWNLSKQFAIYANIGLSSLVNSQNYKFYRNQQNNILNWTSPTAVPSNDLNQTIINTSWARATRLTNNLDFALGLRWDMNFCNDAFHIGINCGYEQHSYWTMNVTSTGFGIGDTDFNLQGIALGGRFDF